MEAPYRAAAAFPRHCKEPFVELEARIQGLPTAGWHHVLRQFLKAPGWTGRETLQLLDVIYMDNKRVSFPMARDDVQAALAGKPNARIAKTRIAVTDATLPNFPGHKVCAARCGREGTSKQQCCAVRVHGHAAPASLPHLPAHQIRFVLCKETPVAESEPIRATDACPVKQYRKKCRESFFYHQLRIDLTQVWTASSTQGLASAEPSVEAEVEVALSPDDLATAPGKPKHHGMHRFLRKVQDIVQLAAQGKPQPAPTTSSS